MQTDINENIVACDDGGWYYCLCFEVTIFEGMNIINIYLNEIAITCSIDFRYVF